jgi:predicted DNA-binding ArsR family transcriptional regulator
MDTAKRCRDQSSECLHLMKLAQSEAEARVLESLSHSWVRIANQTERYGQVIKGRASPK